MKQWLQTHRPQPVYVGQYVCAINCMWCSSENRPVLSFYTWLGHETVWNARPHESLTRQLSVNCVELHKRWSKKCPGVWAKTSADLIGFCSTPKDTSSLIFWHTRSLKDCLKFLNQSKWTPVSTSRASLRGLALSGRGSTERSVKQDEETPFPNKVPWTPAMSLLLCPIFF